MRKIVGVDAMMLLALTGGLMSTALGQPCERLYADSRATLSGIVVERMRPGAPNYASTLQGDKAEIHRVLRLGNEKCVEMVEDGSVAKTSLVQLHFIDIKQSQIERSLRGCPVRIAGEVFAAASGHHHTPLLLTVELVESASGQKAQLPGDHEATPNPSVEARPNGKPPSPGRRYGVHCLRPGLGVSPSVPPHLKR